MEGELMFEVSRTKLFKSDIVPTYNDIILWYQIMSIHDDNSERFSYNQKNKTKLCIT